MAMSVARAGEVRPSLRGIKTWPFDPAAALEGQQEMAAQWERVKGGFGVRPLETFAHPGGGVSLHPGRGPRGRVVKVVCISDTHSMHDAIEFPIPDGDILVHAGDFTRLGLPSEVTAFNSWLGSLPHRHKVVACFVLLFSLLVSPPLSASPSSSLFSFLSSSSCFSSCSHVILLRGGGGRQPRVVPGPQHGGGGC